MLYLITEDRTSGRRFWNKLFSELLGADKYRQLPFDKNSKSDDVTGNTSLDAQVNNVLKQIEVNDGIFIAFDNIGSSKRVNRITGEKAGFDSGDFIIRTLEKCNLFKVNLYFTLYYCFEELYLSYGGLEELYKEDGRDRNLLNVLGYVKKHIKDGTEYFDINNKYVKYIIDIRKDAGKNKEHFADALLYHATDKIKHGLFRISKESKKDCVLKCWTGTCDELRKNTKELSEKGFFCKNCKFRMKDAGSVNKLLDLNDDSLFCDSVFTLRDIQNSVV